jgi:hypothetical protein
VASLKRGKVKTSLTSPRVNCRLPAPINVILVMVPSPYLENRRTGKSITHFIPHKGSWNLALSFS